MKSINLFLVLTAWFVACGHSAAQSEDIFARAESLARRTEGKVFRDVVTPHWLPDNLHFWYRVTIAPDTNMFWWML